MRRTVRADSLSQVLEIYGDGKTVLSLDCFDTLLWRATHSPSDIFNGLVCGPRVRTWSEALQRQFNYAAIGSTEVNLAEIHQRAYPYAVSAALRERMNEELLLEHSMCFGFSPIVDLMHAAKARGMRVIVVSDTYLNEQQLRALIEHAAGTPVLAMIDHVFCSSDFRTAKVNGLFNHVLAALKIPPNCIVHVGDNFEADHEGANRAGLCGVHFEQFPADLAQRFRLESAGGLIMHSELKSGKAAFQLHRAALAAGWAGQHTAAARVGFGSLGPLLTAYSEWFEGELAQLAQDHTAQAIVPLFLMRDSHLPLQVFNARTDRRHWKAKAVDLSRFCAHAASFDSERSVLEYLGEFGGTGRFDMLSKQLLFSADEIGQLHACTSGAQPLAAYIETVTQSDNLKKILARSAAYADRLCTYLRAQAQIEPGQTLVFADLGYAGTIQEKLAPMLRARMRVNVQGRYLLLRDMPGWKLDKAGLFDASWLDHRTLDALAAYIAVVEQLCTSEQASCVDFTVDGCPIRQKRDVKSRQSLDRQRAQRACLNYAEQWPAAFTRAPDACGVEEHRLTALQVLSRLLFMPNRDETELFAAFEHDLNMGVDDRVRLFDPAAAREGLISRGLFYTNNNPRQYLPAELRETGLDLALNVLLLRRFAPDLRHPDFQGSPLQLPIMVADQAQLIPSSVAAMPTHEGYYIASMPIGAARFSIGVKFGECLEWFQLQSVEAVPVGVLMSAREDEYRVSLIDRVVFEGMSQPAPGLVQCLGRESFLFVPPPDDSSDADWVLNIIFRPLAFSQSQAPVRPAAAELVTAD